MLKKFLIIINLVALTNIISACSRNDYGTSVPTSTPQVCSNPEQNGNNTTAGEGASCFNKTVPNVIAAPISRPQPMMRINRTPGSSIPPGGGGGNPVGPD